MSMDNESNLLNLTQLAKTRSLVIKRYSEDYRLKLDNICQNLHIHKSIELVFFAYNDQQFLYIFTEQVCVLTLEDERML